MSVAIEQINEVQGYERGYSFRLTCQNGDKIINFEKIWTNKSNISD